MHWDQNIRSLGPDVSVSKLSKPKPEKNAKLQAWYDVLEADFNRKQLELEQMRVSQDK